MSAHEKPAHGGYPDQRVVSVQCWNNEPRIVLPQAFFDEFGKDASDTVQDFARACVLADRMHRSRCSCEVPVAAKRDCVAPSSCRWPKCCCSAAATR